MPKYTVDVKELVELAIDEKQEAFEELYNITYKKAYFIAQQIVGNKDEAQDILQESYIVAFRKLETLEDKYKFVPWFNQIVVNKCKDYLRKNKPLLFSDLSKDEDDVEVDFMNIEIENPVEIQIELKDVKNLINIILSKLNEEQRLCILMHYFNEMTIHEIAINFNCSENTIKSRLNYARKLIKEEILIEERKSGIKFHSISLPTFLLAINMIVDDNVVPNFTINNLSIQVVGNGLVSKIKHFFKLKKSRLIKTVSSTTVKKGIFIVVGAVGIGAIIPFITLKDKIDNSVLTASLFSGMIQIEDKVIDIPNNYTEFEDENIVSLNELNYSTSDEASIAKIEGEMQLNKTLFMATIYETYSKNDKVVLEVKANKVGKRIYFPKGIHVGSTKKEIYKLWGTPTKIQAADDNSFDEYIYSSGNYRYQSEQESVKLNGEGYVKVLINVKTGVIEEIEYKPEIFTYGNYITGGEYYSYELQNTETDKEFLITYELPFALFAAYSNEKGGGVYRITIDQNDYLITKSDTNYELSYNEEINETEYTDGFEYGFGANSDEPNLVEHKETHEKTYKQQFEGKYKITDINSGTNVQSYILKYKIDDSIAIIEFNMVPEHKNQKITPKSKKMMREIVERYAHSLNIKKIN